MTEFGVKQFYYYFFLLLISSGLQARPCDRFFIKKENLDKVNYLEGAVSSHSVKLDFSKYKYKQDNYYKNLKKLYNENKDVFDHREYDLVFYPLYGKDIGLASTLSPKTKVSIGIDNHPFFDYKKIKDSEINLAVRDIDMSNMDNHFTDAMEKYTGESLLASLRNSIGKDGEILSVEVFTTYGKRKAPYVHAKIDYYDDISQSYKRHWHIEGSVTSSKDMSDFWWYDKVKNVDSKVTIISRAEATFEKRSTFTKNLISDFKENDLIIEGSRLEGRVRDDFVWGELSLNDDFRALGVIDDEAIERFGHTRSFEGALGYYSRFHVIDFSKMKPK